MDVINKYHCTPHLNAETLLFKHKRVALGVFRDVIGINEIDHISIACINMNDEVIFISHTPSIEYNLITSGLWVYDMAYHFDFYKNNNNQYWDQLYHHTKLAELTNIKQTTHQFSSGFSIPIKQDNCHLIYSFATKSKDAHSKSFFCDKQDELVKIGHYCFHKLATIFLPNDFDQKRASVVSSNRYLKLVVNNRTSLHVSSERMEIS